jgi:serine/threonine-protein kinase
MSATLPTGTHLGRYEIRSRLGAGGMGEVYLAQDTKLGRRVALKLLPASYTADADRLRRFGQEARAASALNHPHILTIYEIGNEGATHFIATEFVDGQTLRARVCESPLGVREALRVCEQVASALAAAHEAGVIHRDLKPENVMLRRDGYVKVLDFGLAKLTEKHAEHAPADSQASTRALVKTAPGVVLGTVAYMSPEQARGLETDARTDVWSLGVVLYEMVAGRQPFAARTATDVLALVLHKEPPALRLFNPEAPDELGRIVTKALAKDAAERYQTAKDLQIDLRNLLRKLEVDAEIERSTAPDAETAADAETARGVSTEARGGAARTFEVETPRTTTSAARVAELFRRRGRVAAFALAALVIASAAFVAYRFFYARGAAIDSIAVLPLVNEGGDPNTEYLSDGISEALINSLTELRQLRVVARTTAFRYRGREGDPQAVGRELNARAVLTGRVRQLGDALDVQVDLVDAQTGAQLWGGDYERKVSDLLSVKQAIAREVTEKLRLRLSGEEQRQLVRHDTTNPEAYQFYLRGRYYWNKRTAEGFYKAIEQFQQSVERDPNYALGYVGLADCYDLMELYTGTPASETMPKARAAADRALQLDDTLAEAHASSALSYVGLWRWAEAEAEFKRAINLNPNYPTAHHWFSTSYLLAKRRFDDALGEIKRAQELDPLSPIISTNVCGAYLLKNDPDSAIAECQRVIQLDPGFLLAHTDLGWAYFKQRRYEEATAEFQKAVELSGRGGYFLSHLGYSYAVTGRRAEALAVLKELEEKYAKHEAIGLNLAAVYVGLGDKDRAFAWLEKDYEQRSGYLSYIAWNFHFDDLRTDPRYADLVRRMGLQP